MGNKYYFGKLKIQKTENYVVFSELNDSVEKTMKQLEVISN